ncbi:rh blood group, D antigen [Cynoglossus semilaevis]|uniref:rh blood group, D antigen n=1 Tax=Cynoglossus semilaevis TaxID=244447 RepID=UPI000495D8CB|nr:ammonium transporter Rh type A-like [Cynoglossus semilaevis]XP_024914734.1 ammonium transporter Rh type A-like [Cynoglossus semilaevis]
MAPRYAPSLRSRLAPLLLCLQTSFIVLFCFFTEIQKNSNIRGETFSSIYPGFQDVNVMLFLGFGFFFTFPVRYGFSATAFTLLVAVVATQWGIILNGLEPHRGKIKISLKSLVEAELCTASAMISIAAVQGKTNPVQLVLISLLEVSGFILNKWVLQSLLKVSLLNSIMLLHIFGSFFGLLLTWVFYRKGCELQFEKEKYDQKSGLFSMLGTLFLWMYLPTFNSVLVDDRIPGRKLKAVCSTYLALAVSAVTAASMSSLCHPRGKVNMTQMQQCILAGGVAVGVSVSGVQHPWEAMTIGFTAAVIATIGHQYLQTQMLHGFQCHDTCATLSSFGLPGLLGWVAHLLLEIRDCDDQTTAIRFAVFHICSLLITIALSLSTGLITGLLLKLEVCRRPPDNKCFDDQVYWEFPHLAERK